MNDIWFTSDTHFGHKNILEYQKEERSYSCIEDHDEDLIKRWNERVKPSDIVFHLGDFCLSKKFIPIADRLNGRKRLILGNHEQPDMNLYLPYFEDIYGVTCYSRKLDRIKFVLSHVPLHPNHRWEFNLHGHLHSHRMQEYGYINVGVDQNCLYPFNLEQIMEMAKGEPR